MHVIGTAGHVDHGKSTLIEALTGIHPDRLKEEREREMTIDLGFAWLKLPNGEDIGIVDVPGHRDFIENMLAGIGGIDVALFVVAADEGIMPQTREHLAILDILQIQKTIIVITKIDLVDEEWLSLVEEDLRNLINETGLRESSFVYVSAKTKRGLSDLIGVIEDTITNIPARVDVGRPRLPVDRVFTLAGFGTIVTGTLSDGKFRTGDEIVVLPGQIRGRIRGLQTHLQKEDIALPGSRTAINLSNVALDQVIRGNVIAHPGDYQPTQRIDVSFRLTRDAKQPLKHNTQVKLFIGSTETMARVRLLGLEEILPGNEGWLQIELTTPVVAVRGDHYILRRPSPGETLGGGKVVDPHPSNRHKRFSVNTITQLENISHGTPAEIFYQTLISIGAAPISEIHARSNLDHSLSIEDIQDLITSGLVVPLDALSDKNGHIIDSQTLSSKSSVLLANKGFWEQVVNQAQDEVEIYHKNFPLRSGMPREELKSRLKNSMSLSPRVLNASMSKLIKSHILDEAGLLVKLPDFTIRLTRQQEISVDRLMVRFQESPFSPPSIKECQSQIGEDLYNMLVDSGVLMAVSQEVVFRKSDYELMIMELKQMMQNNGPVTASQVRDKFNTSRKYTLALLEYLDGVGLTVREGDYRRLKSPA